MVCVSSVSLVAMLTLARPKSRILTRPGFGHHHVAGLEIAVHDARGVRRAQRIGNLHAVLQRLGHAQAARRNQVRQRLPRHILHHHVFGFLIAGDVVNRDDIRMIEGGGGLRFLNEAAAAVAIAGACVGQHLDRDHPVQARVLRLPDLAHSAGAELLNYLVMGNRTPNHNAPQSTDILVCHRMAPDGHAPLICCAAKQNMVSYLP